MFLYIIRLIGLFVFCLCPASWASKWMD